MEVIVTYDVSAKQVEFKAAMESFGYRDRWKSNDKLYYLPNTTLWQQNKALQDAVNDAKKVAADLRVTLQRCIAVESSTWAGITGEHHV